MLRAEAGLLLLFEVFLFLCSKSLANAKIYTPEWEADILHVHNGVQRRQFTFYFYLTVSGSEVSTFESHCIVALSLIASFSLAKSVARNVAFWVVCPPCKSAK